MSYNLLLDTDFKTNNHNWEFINCKYENGYLISYDKVFGIKQKLLLAQSTKLYYRFKYNVDNISVKDVKIGIQNKDVLHIDRKTPKLRKNQMISVIDYAEQPNIELHLIFESDTKVNKVKIWEPILVDLNRIGKSTWLKWILDKTIKFREGYHYTNLYPDCELKPNIPNLLEYNFSGGKIGSILSSKNNIDIKLNAKFIVNRYYLIKLDYEEINELGTIYLQYGVLKSNKLGNQLYLVIKGNYEDLHLIIEPNDVLDYQVNLKHLLIIDITDMRLLKEDIEYLPFI